MDLVEAINTSLSSHSNQEKREYIGASTIGKPCVREIWYRYHGIEGQPISPKLSVTFMIGKKLESMVIELLENAGITLEKPSEDNNFLFCKDEEIKQMQGHLDCIASINNVDNQRVIVEIKTAKDSMFQKFKREGLRKWSESYYAQVQCYMGMTGIHSAILLALNKDTSEMHHEWVNFDFLCYEELKEKAKNILESKEPPMRINKNPTFYICQQCQYRRICHVD